MMGPIPTQIRNNPQQLQEYLVSLATHEVIELVLEGYLAVEVIQDRGVKIAVIQAYKAQQQERAEQERLAAEDDEEMEDAV